MAGHPAAPAVRAAGTIPWRDGPSGLEVLVVHRGRQNDWSWPKGRLDPGEGWVACAARETEEETGYPVRVGVALPSRRYTVPQRGPKEVRYWAAQVVGPAGALDHETDEVRWVTPERARNLVTRPADVPVLDALVQAHEDDALRTWPLLVVRHAVALSRSKYTGKDDRRRPLTDAGHVRAQSLALELAAYRPQALVSSPATRCMDTLRPTAKALGLKIARRDPLSEEGHEASSAATARVLRAVLAAGEPAALCSHRPVLPALLDQLALLAVAAPDAVAVLARASERGLRKGEVLACHLRGSGADAQVVAAEVLES